MKKLLLASFIFITLFLLNANNIKAANCGEISTVVKGEAPSDCNCGNWVNLGSNVNPYVDSYCCGWYEKDVCLATKPSSQPKTPGSTNTEVDEKALDMINPIKIFSTKQTELEDPGSIISRILEFAFPIAGLILFVMLTWGGFEMLVSSTNKANVDAGKQRVTAAVIGFVILFAAYWIAQILETVFNIAILG